MIAANMHRLVFARTIQQRERVDRRGKLMLELPALVFVCCQLGGKLL